MIDSPKWTWVRRAPVLPLEVALDGADSMLGKPLPAQGTISVRLDGDGDASSEKPGDLTAVRPAVAGSTTAIVLEGT